MNSIEDVKNYTLRCFYNSIISNPEILEIEGKHSDILNSIKDMIHETQKYWSDIFKPTIMMNYESFNYLERECESMNVFQYRDKYHNQFPTILGLEIILDGMYGFEDYILLISFNSLGINDFTINYYKQNAKVKLSE